MEALCSEDDEFGVVEWPRGMLSGPSAVNSAGGRGGQVPGRGGDQFPCRGNTAGSGGEGILDGAGTSRSRGAGVGRVRERGSSSEEE